MNDYSDIINLKRPPSKHPKLSIESRAAQFAPFAALTGYNNAIKEKARLTEKKINLTEEQKQIINNKIIYLENHIKEKTEVKITYFIKDELKEGGKYIKENGIIKKIDHTKQTIKYENNKIIPIKNIIEIESILFDKN